jgi:hypothetical protein
LSLSFGEARAKDSDLPSDESNSLIADSMFQGYVALPLPLRRRVHRNILNLVDVLFGGVTFAFISGLLVYLGNLFLPVSCEVFGCTIPYRFLFFYAIGVISSIVAI